MTHFRAISMIVFITFLAIGCGSSGGGGDIVGGDNDGDGFTESQGDCNNSNAGINPGASEICGDGIDQDCNGIDVICTLSVPANVQATAGEGTITVSWDVASYADSYYVYWTTTQGDGTNGNAIAVTGTSLDHEKLIYGEEYYYVVTAVNITGESLPSGVATSTPGQKLISSITFKDANLETCVITESAAYIDELVSLNCSSSGVTDLAGIGWLTSLTDLDLESNSISEVSPLASLTRLTHIYLRYNNIIDVSPFASLPSITYLHLGSNSISDISPLASLTTLTYLNLKYNNISDVSPLASLTSLSNLYLKYNSISDVSPLASLTSLADLNLKYNNISDVSPLATLTSITYLDLESNSISDVSPLAILTSITYLDLSINSITTGIISLVSLTSATNIALLENNDIPCADLTALTDALGSEVVEEPSLCQ